MKSVIIDTAQIQFIMTECPTLQQIHDFILLLKYHNVNYLLRINKDLYDTNLILQEIPNLIIKNLYFPDGEFPNIDVINEYIEFKKECCIYPIIAIHCVASLGRSPCIIALEMINQKMFNDDRFAIIDYIRNKRKGAFNNKQLKWILEYKPPKNFTKGTKISFFNIINWLKNEFKIFNFKH
jgi:protein tyrosine phosphatase type 4A